MKQTGKAFTKSMFEDKTHSLGDLDSCDAYWAIRFLQGHPWENLFGSFDAVPPDWLLNWSAEWSASEIFTIDDVDPLIGEYLLVIDNSTDEVWAAIHQGDQEAAFERIPTTGASPDRDKVCRFFLEQLEAIGDYPFIGNFTVHSTEWIPRRQMEAFLKKQMKALRQTELHGLTLEAWLEREYGQQGKS